MQKFIEWLSGILAGFKIRITVIVGSNVFYGPPPTAKPDVPPARVAEPADERRMQAAAKLVGLLSRAPRNRPE